MANNSIPSGRIIEKLDGYLNKKDYDGAKRHLNYWLEETKALGDNRGRLMILNEQIGIYRKTDCKDECISAVQAAVRLARTDEFRGTVTYATTLLNAATGYKAFGFAEEAVELYEEAKDVYEKELDNDDSRLAGLYNNMALALVSIKQYERARELYDKALQTLSYKKGNEAEEAITYLNMADLVSACQSNEEAEPLIEEYLTKAQSLLDSDEIARDGYYAFVCEKCAPVFGYYGYFMVEKDLIDRAENIYEGN